MPEDQMFKASLAYTVGGYLSSHLQTTKTIPKQQQQKTQTTTKPKNATNNNSALPNQFYSVTFFELN